ncbi:MAG: hypothetical protein QOG52_468 [Frankiaceae bacterium]|jgi:hypothetical protein|nr:hypothetical protein [Frankiaceae bacterium]
MSARRRQRQLVLFVGVTSLASMVGGVAIASVTHPGPVDWAVLGIVLATFAALLCGLLFVLYRRGSRSNSMFAPSPLLALPASDRRRLVRVIKRGEVAIGPDRDIAVATAEHMCRKGPLLLAVTAAVVQLLAAVAAGPGHATKFWISITAFAAMSVAAEELFRLRRRAARFLAMNGNSG